MVYIFFYGSTIVAHASVTNLTAHDKTKLWYMRLEHVSEKGLVEVEK